MLKLWLVLMYVAAAVAAGLVAAAVSAKTEHVAFSKARRVVFLFKFGWIV